jgi:SAM-dependent methyltransferase
MRGMLDPRTDRRDCVCVGNDLCNDFMPRETEPTDAPTSPRTMWNKEALTFDDAADHGLGDSRTREAWRQLLRAHLPQPPRRIADLGSGTGTLSLLLAEEGYSVDGVDFSSEMVARAIAKAGHLDGVTFTEADAMDPPLPEAAYDVVLSRHVLWAMPDPGAALRRWLGLLAAGGTLLLVEGFWGNGAGLTGAQTLDLVLGTGRSASLHELDDPILWGRPVEDERYLVVSRA